MDFVNTLLLQGLAGPSAYLQERFPILLISDLNVGERNNFIRRKCLDECLFCGKADGKGVIGILRPGAPHAVCVAIHESVWMDIGYFASMPKLWGYEDTMFFHAARKAGIASGITGASWLHHFGSITLSALKRERGLSDGQGLSDRRSYRLLHESWLARKLQKARRLRQLSEWRARELAQYGMTLHGVREHGAFRWL